MKRCPECNSLFNDMEHFCELDGSPLIPADNASDAVIIERTMGASQTSDKRGLLPIVGIVGVLLGVLLVLIYFMLIRDTGRENASQSASNSSIVQQQIPSRPSQPSPTAVVSPSVEPSPSPTIEPSPSPQNTPQRNDLSSNPISTDQKGKSGPVIIRLDSGLTIDADEAWQTGEGIWYRKHGVVSLLDPKHVKAIEKAPTATPLPTASTANPSP